ncbi:MAG: DNA polymerase IV [Desulfobacterales bacterium]|jgi:DNA polymerase IV
MPPIRKIIHIDMDAFYASVEQRDRPGLKGKPVIVGGDPQARGVVAACSYEARKFGIHSAMASSTAHRLCPGAVFIRPRFEVYKAVSSQIREIFCDYTDLVEPLSLDEAFLDVTQNHMRINSATLIAREIKKKIYERTGKLTASAGVSFNKFLAKVASDINKPNGIMVILPEVADEFIGRLPIRKFFGVGKVTEEKMHALGIKTGADLRKFDKERLIQLFGKTGAYYHDIARGVDDRPVEPNRIRKSIGKETTLPEDIDDIDQMVAILEDLSFKVENTLTRSDVRGRTVSLKIKYFDFKSITRSVTVEAPVETAAAIMKYVRRLLSKTAVGEKKVRLLGISISNFDDQDACCDSCGQLLLPFRFRNDPSLRNEPDLW